MEEGRVSEKWAYLAVQTGTDLISATPAARHTSCPVSPHASLCLAALNRLRVPLGVVSYAGGKVSLLSTCHRLLKGRWWWWFSR